MNLEEIFESLGKYERRLDELEQLVIANIEHTARIIAKRVVDEELAELREEIGLE